MKDYYRILGVLPQANDKEIKAAFRKLAKQYHPDAVKDNPKLTEKMYEIGEAYDVPGDPQKRKEYDECLRNETDQKKDRPGNTGEASNPDMSRFERFFGFQAGKGMETYREQRPGTKKADGPIHAEELFTAYFAQKK